MVAGSKPPWSKRVSQSQLDNLEELYRARPPVIHHTFKLVPNTIILRRSLTNKGNGRFSNGMLQQIGCGKKDYFGWCPPSPSGKYQRGRRRKYAFLRQPSSLSRPSRCRKLESINCCFKTLSSERPHFQ